MTQKLAILLVMMLLVSMICVPVGYAAWTDNQTFTEDFQGYSVAEGEYIDLKTATNNLWEVSSTYMKGYLTKQNGNVMVVAKDFNADALINTYLTKKEGTPAINWYNEADRGEDKLFRAMQNRLTTSSSTLLGDISLEKNETYTLDFDFKYMFGDQVVTATSDRAGFLFPTELITAATGGASSYPAYASLTAGSDQQLYGSNRISDGEDGFRRAGMTVTPTKIMQRSGYDTTKVEVNSTGVNRMAFEFKGMGKFPTTNNVESVFTMIDASFAEYIAELKANPESTNLPALKTAATADFKAKIAAADIKFYVDNIELQKKFADTLSLEQNQTYYTSERAEAPLLVKGYKVDGTSYDLTGSNEVTYTSSDPSVFQFTEGNKLKSTGKSGYSTITATYRGVSASVLMIRATAAPVAKDESGMPAAYKVAAGGMAGHDGGQAYMHNSSSPVGAYQLRLYVGRNDWYGQGYHTMTGWFYDDMAPTTRASIYMMFIDSIQKDANNVYHADFVEDYSYGSFDWTGKNLFSHNMTAGLIDTNQGSYHYKNGTTRVNIAPRSKGWHQLTAMFLKDETADWGWSIVYFIDGVEFRKISVIPRTETTGFDCCAELRAIAVGDPVIDSYYDDFFMTGSMAPVDTSVGLTLAIGANGSVKVNNVTKNNGDVVKVEQGDTVTVIATPNEGYEIEAISLGSTSLTPDATGSVTLENIQADATLSVTFKARATKPNVSSDTTYNYFTEEFGTPTAYVFGKLNNFFGTSTDGYGMNVWVAGAPEQTIQLPAMVSAGQPAVAAPNAAFVIKVFGDAIQSDQSYVFQPYVGETTGDEIPVEFEE